MSEIGTKRAAELPLPSKRPAKRLKAASAGASANSAEAAGPAAGPVAAPATPGHFGSIPAETFGEKLVPFFVRGTQGHAAMFI